MKSIFLPFPRVCCFRAIEATQIVHLHTDSDSFQMPNIIFYAEKLIDLALFERVLRSCLHFANFEALESLLEVGQPTFRSSAWIIGRR